MTPAEPVTLDELRAMLGTRFQDLVKAVVDLRNLRSSFGNRSRGVDDPGTRDAIARLVERLVRR